MHRGLPGFSRVLKNLRNYPPGCFPIRERVRYVSVTQAPAERGSASLHSPVSSTCYAVARLASSLRVRSSEATGSSPAGTTEARSSDAPQSKMA